MEGRSRRARVSCRHLIQRGVVEVLRRRRVRRSSRLNASTQIVDRIRRPRSSLSE